MIQFQPTGGDDTAALQAAVDAGSVEILPGDSLVSGTITVPSQRDVVVRKGAQFVRGHAILPLFSLGSETQLLGARIVPGNLARTAGPDIRVPPSSVRVKIEDTFLLGAHWGIETDSTIFDIDTIEIRDTLPGGVGIVVNQGFDQAIRHMVMDAPQNCAAGIWVNATGDLVIQDINVMHAGWGLVLAPNNGQVSGNVRVSDSFLDSSNIGFLASPAAGGHVIFCRFTNCWIGNHQNQAALVGGAGNIGDGGIEFVSCDFVQSWVNGITVTNPSAKAARNVKTLGGKNATVTYVS